MVEEPQDNGLEIGRLMPPCSHDFEDRNECSRGYVDYENDGQRWHRVAMNEGFGMHTAVRGSYSMGPCGQVFPLLEEVPLFELSCVTHNIYAGTISEATAPMLWSLGKRFLEA